jgi:hypothetical protein
LHDPAPSPPTSRVEKKIMDESKCVQYNPAFR